MALVLILWLAGLGAAAQFGKISVLFEELGRIYSAAGDLGIGLIVSVMGTVGLIFGTTAGLLVGRIGPKRAIVGGMLLGAAVSLVEMLLPAFELMIAMRILEGFSHIVIVVVGPTMIAGLAPDEKRPLAMTLWSSFFGVAYAVLALVAPPIIGLGGAPGLFLAHAGWMTFFALILLLTLPQDPPREKLPFGNLITRHIHIYGSAKLAAPAFGFFCYTFLYVAILTLLPSKAPLAVTALMAAGLPLISIAVSLTFGVWILRFISAVRLVQWGFLFGIPGALILWAGWGDAIWMVMGGFWISAALGIAQGASFAAIPELNEDPDDQASASGAVAQMGNLGTAIGTPILAALIAAYGPAGLALTSLVCCLLGVTLHSLLAWRRGDRLI